MLKLLAVAALCYAAIAVWVYSSQRRMLYFPWKDLVAAPDEIGLDHEDVWLSNRLGTTVHGWWLPHPEARLTLLFSHGNGGNVSHRLESLRLFHELGLSVFVYDYSGYGRSGGEPSEEGTRADARAAWDWLVCERGVKPGTVVLFGRSLGGAVTAHLANELRREGVSPAGIIMESTFTSVPEMGARLYPWLPVRLLASYSYDSAAELSEVRLPALFAHSADDEIVPYELGHELYEGYLGPKLFFEMRGDHNTGYRGMGDDYPAGLDRFLAGLERGGE